MVVYLLIKLMCLVFFKLAFQRRDYGKNKIK